MTDGNTYAINKHLNEREDFDALQEVTAELEQAEARIEGLEGKLARAVDVLLESVEPSELEEGEADNIMLIDRIEELEAEVTYWKADSAAAWDKCEEHRLNLAKAVEALDEAVYLLAPNEKDMMRQGGVYRIVTTLAELKGEQDE